MSGNIEYSFCPECGALMSGTVCSACGFSKKEDDLFSDFNVESVYTTGDLNAGVQKVNKYERQERKKAKVPVIVWILSGVVGLLLLLVAVVAVVAICFGLFWANSVQTPVGHSAPSSTQHTVVSSEEEESEDISEDDMVVQTNEAVVSKLQGIKNVDVSGVDELSYFDSADSFVVRNGMPLEMYNAYYDIFPYFHVNVPREELTDLYYNKWGDSFDYNCGYSIEGHSIDYSDVENDVYYNAYIGYYQLVGEHIPNVEELNSLMYEQAINPLIAQLSGKGYYQVSQEYYLYVEPFVTYNDDKKMSVIYLVDAFFDGYREQLYLVSQNIDLEQGCLLTTSDLIQLEDSFAAEFKERSLKQNGSYPEALDGLTDTELIDYLMDDETNILFFSPCGLEIGVNYLENNNGWGWLTVTLREMSDVLADDSFDFIKSAKSTWAAPNGEAYDLDEALQDYYEYLNKKSSVLQEPDIQDYEEDYDDGFVLPSDEQGETGDL